jgi:hypothetical protein
VEEPVQELRDRCLELRAVVGDLEVRGHIRVPVACLSRPDLLPDDAVHL